jgi:hypothetical protein
MKRILRLAVVLLAVAMHVVAPVAAYAMAMPDVARGDFCSAARGIPAALPGRHAPLPSNEHHCAHAPCCVCGALDSVAPPPRALAVVATALDSAPAWISRSLGVPASAIMAAQPRGPPALP